MVKIENKLLFRLKVTKSINNIINFIKKEDHLLNVNNSEGDIIHYKIKLNLQKKMINKFAN